MLEVVLRGMEVVLRGMDVVLRGMNVVLRGIEVVLSSGALKSFLLLEVSPCISMITTFNTLHFYSLVHFELGHSLSFMPCFVITVLLMYQQFLHQAMNKRAIQNETNMRQLAIKCQSTRKCFGQQGFHLRSAPSCLHIIGGIS